MRGTVGSSAESGGKLKKRGDAGEGKRDMLGRLGGRFKENGMGSMRGRVRSFKRMQGRCKSGGMLGRVRGTGWVSWTVRERVEI